MHIIVCGNRERVDDGAGVRVGERLRELGMEVDVQSGEALSLIEAWVGHDDVVLVDSVMTGSPPGTVHIWENPPGLPSLRSPASSHGFGVAEAIELARALGRLPRRLHIFGIEGEDFRLGQNLSPRQQSAVNQVVRLIVERVSADAFCGR